MSVSRALRGPKGVTAETRERVLKAAQELDYRPNPILSALSSYRQRLHQPRNFSQIAFVTNFKTELGWQKLTWVNNYFLGAQERGRQLGYDVVNFWLKENGMNQSRASEVLYHRGIKGLILPPFPPARTRAHLKLDWDRFSSVVLGYWLAKPNLHLVAQDHHMAGLMACHQLRRLRFRRIGLAMWAGNSIRETHTLLDAYYGEQQRFPQTGSLPPFLWHHFEQEFKRFQAWFSQHQPDVLLTNGAGELPGAIARLSKAAWRKTPVAYTALGENDPAEWPGVRHNMKMTGYKAVDELHLLLTRGETGIPQGRTCNLIEGFWQAPSGFGKGG
ncbi:MAG: LacI family DNA-binding transcriptional regulator [Blastochloris sp.]|nr:LacI family DNA-binding transcriptional regulator [Blastochloris sp.]